jgi:hypothetical protein
MRGWTSVYYAGPVVPASQLRTVAEVAGCHIYSQSDDPFYASSSYVAMHARTPGRKTIVLPRVSAVRDAHAGEVIGKGVTSFSFVMKEFETRIFEITRLFTPR